MGNILISARMESSFTELTALWCKSSELLGYSNHLVCVFPTLGAPTIADNGRIQSVCFGLWEQHNEDIKSRAHVPAGKGSEGQE